MNRPPLTDAMREGLLLLREGPARLSGHRCDRERWLWRTPAGRVVPEQTLGALIRRRLAKNNAGASRTLTGAGQREAERIAAANPRAS
jgi:hypothetical protein